MNENSENSKNMKWALPKAPETLNESKLWNNTPPPAVS